MKKKAVLLIVPTLAQGGQEKVCLMTADLLCQDQRFDIYIVVFDEKKLFYDVGELNIINLNLPAKNGLIKKAVQIVRRVNAVKHIKKNKSIACSYSFGTTAGIVNVFSKKIFSKKNGKILVGIRGYLSLQNRLQRMFVYPGADVTVCCSKSMAEDAKNIYGITNALPLTNPVNAEDICRKAGQQIVSLKKADEKIIITAGRIHKVKGYWHLLKAFSLMKKKYPGARLVHIGEGNPKPYIGLAENLGIGDSVDFLGVKNNPFPYFKSADLYVLSSLSEGFPNAMLEAMAIGLPVIATDCKSGPREILHEDINDPVFKKKGIIKADYGILVPVMNNVINWDAKVFEKEEKYLADAILQMFSDEEHLMKYKRKSIERVKKYTTENYLHELNKLLCD